MEYSFHVQNKLAADGLAMATEKLLKADEYRKTVKKEGAGLRVTPFTGTNKPPVIVCVGSDLAIGDSLGPITGSMLRYKTQGLNVYVYGTLAAPITAKEIKYIRAFLKETHKGSQIVTIDAAVGESGDIGLIKITDKPLLPGAGANKKLGSIGDLSILGIVAEKSVANYGLLNTTRLNLVYTMSEIISEGLASLLWERCGTKAKESPKNA